MDLKKVFVIGTAGFVVVCFGLFYILTNSIRISTNRNQREENLANMEKKLQSLEAAFQSHKMSMKELEVLALAKDDKVVVESPLDPNSKVDDVENNENDDQNQNHHPQDFGSSFSSSCSASVGLEKQASANINMLDVYDLLKFDNPNGGVWKQGFNIKVDSSRFSQTNKLKIFIIKHSHNDPGWLKTFEKYFEDQTKHILDNMLQELSSNPSLKFIWAEISYFNLWWNKLSLQEKQEVIRIVENKQLEFVTGGWVMPDEANSHFYSILLQLTEGHQWLLHHLNTIPKNGWSIDPFGLSPTMAYILKRAGMSNMLIQRTHYSVKKHLSELQELEFKWRQIWDSTGSTDMLCHMMPFYSYDIPHTCGPDPKICCQFDFKRMHGVSTMTCPWNVPPQPIITQNLRERSLTILDQYKKKAMLFKSNVLLIPLGDDFRWEDKPEWDAQTTNYAKIFDYINSTPDLNAEIKFGTLEDYFQALGKEMSAGHFKPNVLSGDFFTYADRDDHYWSGYFTSRPFHKAMDRDLITHLRTAHVLFTTMSAELAKKVGDLSNDSFVRELLGKLIKARRHLSLFQHHDGVTGTSKDHVMVDYAEKLYSGLVACDYVMQKSIHVLNHLKDPTFDFESIGLNNNNLEVGETPLFYEPAMSSDHHHSLPRYNRIVVDKELADRLVTVTNSAVHEKTQLVTIYVSTYYIKVVDIEGEPVPFEILPVFSDQTALSSNTFQLNFIAELDPLSVKNFIIKHDSTAVILEEPPEIILINSPSAIFAHDKFKIKSIQDAENELEEQQTISISNQVLTITFKKNGFASSVRVNNGNGFKEYPFDVGMYKYGVSPGRETSGLYLFIPDGPATLLDTFKPFIKIVKGKFMSYVEVWTKQVKHRVTLYNHPGFESNAISITNLVDIRAENNFELMMRLKTDIKSGGLSYTDLNGFQMIRRKKFDKLPIQANYYPLPTATYIEDDKLRLTLLSRQPLGAASLDSGEIEVMMDRRLAQDDNRGVGQGDKDNLETINSFKVVFEVPGCEDSDRDKKAPMLSIAGHTSLYDLLHPLRIFTSPTPLTPSSLSALSDYSPSASKSYEQLLGCDIELVDLSMLPDYDDKFLDQSYKPVMEAALTLRRVGFDGRFLHSDGIQMEKCSVKENRLGRFSLKDLVGDLFQPKLSQMTLSFIHEGKKLSSDEPIVMKPMEIYAFKTHFGRN